MNKAKHTPGRWSRNIPPATKYNTIFAGRNTHICHLNTTGLPPEEVEANCNLIVAAPELLESVKRLTLLISNVDEVYGVGAAKWIREREPYRLAIAAIAKAEGR